VLNSFIFIYKSNNYVPTYLFSKTYASIYLFISFTFITVYYMFTRKKKQHMVVYQFKSTYEIAANIKND